MFAFLVRISVMVEQAHFETCMCVLGGFNEFLNVFSVLTNGFWQKKSH